MSIEISRPLTLDDNARMVSRDERAWSLPIRSALPNTMTGTNTARIVPLWSKALCYSCPTRSAVSAFG